MALEVDCRRGSDRVAFTLIEMIVALAVGTIVLGLAWSFFSTMMGKKGGPPGLVAGTADSFLRQDGIDGISAMTRRLQEAIQVLEPKPGQTSSKIIFRDLLNDQITIEVKAGGLVSAGANGDEREAVPMKTSAGPFYPVKPIRVPGCSAAQFTSASPSCVVMLLTFKGDNDSTTSLLNTVELQNQNLAK